MLASTVPPQSRTLEEASHGTGSPEATCRVGLVNPYMAGLDSRTAASRPLYGASLTVLMQGRARKYNSSMDACMW